MTPNSMIWGTPNRSILDTGLSGPSATPNQRINRPTTGPRTPTVKKSSAILSRRAEGAAAPTAALDWLRPCLPRWRRPLRGPGDDGSYLGELHDHLDVVWRPLQRARKVVGSFASRHEMRQPGAICAGQGFAGLVPVPLVGIDAADEDVVPQHRRRVGRGGRVRGAAGADAGGTTMPPAPMDRTESAIIESMPDSPVPSISDAFYAIFDARPCETLRR